MSEQDDFDVLRGDDADLAPAALSDQATGLQRTGLGERVENGGPNGSDDGAGAREWTSEEMKLVEPCIKLIKVSGDLMLSSFCLEVLKN